MRWTPLQALECATAWTGLIWMGTMVHADSRSVGKGEGGRERERGRRRGREEGHVRKGRAGGREGSMSTS